MVGLSLGLRFLLFDLACGARFAQRTLCGCSQVQRNAGHENQGQHGFEWYVGHNNLLTVRDELSTPSRRTTGSCSESLFVHPVPFREIRCVTVSLQLECGVEAMKKA